MLMLAKRILDSYVQTQGERLGQMIRTSVEASNWLTKKEPRDVEMIVDMIIGEINAIKSHLDLVYQYTTEAKGTSSQTGPRTTKPSITIFSKKQVIIEFVKELLFTSSSVKSISTRIQFCLVLQECV